MTIPLSDIWQIASPESYKCHFAGWNGRQAPLDVWVRDKVEWQGWQEFRPQRDVFDRPYILSLIQFYHETDTWLFGGVFRLLKRLEDRYEVELTDMGSGYLGRLKLRSPYRGRSTRVNFEDHYLKFEVQEIFRDPYSGRSFPGYGNVELSFGELEALVKSDQPDWRGALESVNGIYLISDKVTKKRYVGSAWGVGGIWSQWCNYIATGNADNLILRTLAEADRGLDYCRNSIQFALLECQPFSTPHKVIIDRESFWRRILLTRSGLY
jgi:hypothetical protein